MTPYIALHLQNPQGPEAVGVFDTHAEATAWVQSQKGGSLTYTLIRLVPPGEGTQEREQRLARIDHGYRGSER